MNNMYLSAPLPFVGNPFKECRRVEFNARMNYNSAYTDIMLYKPAA